MCGFVGWINVDPVKPVELETLRRMNRALAHRGPDDEGYFTRDNVGIGQRRLSIIDLSEKGRQPIFNETGSILVVCNGEIYNYQELRETLTSRGHDFYSNSDSEAIVHAYEEWGEDFVTRLDGMFSLALYDTEKPSLVLAKDHFGKKPLYYALQGGAFLFASEPKAFFFNPRFEAKLNTSALCKYLAYDFVPTPESIYADCWKLQAGHSLVLNPRSLAKLPAAKPYWRLSFEPKLALDEDEAAREMVRLLRESLRKRLMSDVPLGVFLSGGLDSGSLVALLAEILPPHDINTFNIGFGESSYDESPYASKVASYFGTHHHERTLGSDAAIELFPEVVGKLDEPFADASIFPTYLLCGFARKRITVALGGDGGDELFAGYDPFIALGVASLVDRLPLSSLGILRKIESLLPRSEKNMALAFKAHHFLKGFTRYARNQPELRNTIWMGSFPHEAQQAILNPDITREMSWERLYEETIRRRDSSDARSQVDRLIHSFSTLYLHDDILVKVDRASMMNGLEVRSPFLDRNLAEFVARLPAGMKMKGFQRKRLLKKGMKDRLPKEILHRKKKGFGIPTAAWLRGPLREMTLDTLSESRLKAGGIFQADAVGELVRLHLSGVKDFRKEIWALFIFELWRENWMKSGR